MVNSSTNTDTMYKLNIDMVPLYMKSSKYTAFIDKFLIYKFNVLAAVPITTRSQGT